MRLIRTSVVLLVTVVLLAMAVPAAQARSIDKPQPVLHSPGGSWLDVALSWLNRLAGSEPPAAMTAKTTTTTDTTTKSTIIPMTGGCIDPLGTGRCNT